MKDSLLTAADFSYIKAWEEQTSSIIKMVQRLASMHHVSATKRLIEYIQNISAIHHQSPLLIEFIHTYDCMSLLLTFLQDILKDGVDSGEFRNNLNMNGTAIFLLGITNSHFISQPFLTDGSKPLELSGEAYSLQSISMIIHGITRRRENE